MIAGAQWWSQKGCCEEWTGQANEFHPVRDQGLNASLQFSIVNGNRLESLNDETLSGRFGISLVYLLSLGSCLGIVIVRVAWSTRHVLGMASHRSPTTPLWILTNFGTEQ